jgi:site-specific DNA recombinase
MTLMTTPSTEPMPVATRVATYCRVSSDEQADKGTIATQREVIERRIAQTPGIVVVGRFEDDGMSGTIPFADRPAGRDLLLLVDAAAVDQVWVYKVDRLGRDAIDLMVLRRRLEPLGVKIISMQEGEQQDLPFDINAVVADYGRRTFLRLVADGIDRTARAGNYPGGVVAYGFRVDGEKPNARLVPDREPVRHGLSPADIITRMYERVALDDWSCRKVADEFNALGIPTHSELDGPGTRKKDTQKTWGEGRIRNMLVRPLFKGVQTYGERSKKGPREVIAAAIEPIVSDELWDAAQAALARHRVCAKNSDRVYLLRTVMVCSLCGLHYNGSMNRGTAYYRCGGQRRGRGGQHQPCQSRGFKAELLEPLVWQDVEMFLREPGDLIDVLQAEAERGQEADQHARELERVTSALADLDRQRRRAQDLAVRGALGADDLKAQLSRIEADRAALQRHRASVAPPSAPETDVDEDLIARLRCRLDAGLTEAERHEVVRLLVRRITIETFVDDKGKEAKATIEYRFPAVLCTRSARGSWPR